MALETQTHSDQGTRSLARKDGAVIKELARVLEELVFSSLLCHRLLCDLGQVTYHRCASVPHLQSRDNSEALPHRAARIADYEVLRYAGKGRLCKAVC